MKHMISALVKKTGFLFFCCIVFLNPTPHSLAQDFPNKDYVIGAEDVLDIQVWDNDDLHRSVEVSHEGDFTFPLIGTVRAAGLSVFELEKLLKKRLAEGYLVDPHVTVTVSTYKSQKVFVMGEVKNAGTYVIKGRTSVLKVISEAGGLTEEAGRIVTISRPKTSLKPGSSWPSQSMKENMTIVLDLSEMQEDSTDSKYFIVSGDSITVSKAVPVYVTGEVNNSGAYKWEKGMTIRQAITLAGGLTKQAGTTVTISRPKTASKGDSPKGSTGEGDTITSVLDLDELQEGRADERALVFSGDSISVSKAPPIYVTGEVNKPGEFQWEKRITVRQAISLAGGPTSKGAMERARIIRTQNGQEIEIKPDLNDSVKPYDVIRVPQSYF